MGKNRWGYIRLYSILLSLASKICVFLPLALLISCGVPRLPENELFGDLDNSEEKTITVMTTYENLQNAAEHIDQLVDCTTEVVIQRVDSTEVDVLRTRLATGNMPDIFTFNSGALFHAINPAVNLLDLSGEHFVSMLSSQYKESVSIDGRVYGVPITTAFAGVWAYNKQVYKELGLEEPRTWSQLMENCKTIKESGITPILSAYQRDSQIQIIFLMDAHNIISEVPDFPQRLSNHEATFANTSAARRSFEKLAEARLYMNDDLFTVHRADIWERLRTGQGAHLPVFTTHLQSFFENYPEEADNIGIFGQPGDDPEEQGITVWMPRSLYIYKDSPNTELAKQWLAAYLTEGIYTLYDELGGPYVLDGVPLPEAATAMADVIEQFMREGNASLALEYLTPLKGPNSAAICLDVLNGDLKPLAAAIAYDKDVERQAIQLRLQN
jgi:raffinose/stachyose/melibiose transport system substrate-binding protein